MELSERKKLFEIWRNEIKKDNVKITKNYLDAYYFHRDEIPILREAYAHKNYWKHCRIDISEDDLIVGTINTSEPVCFNYGCGTFINYDLADKLIEQDNFDENEKNAFKNMLNEVEKRKYRYDAPIYTEDELNSVHAMAATTTWFGGHMVIDYETLLDIGLSGYAREIEKQKLLHDNSYNDFYKAMEIQFEAVVLYILRLIEKTEELNKNGNKNMGIISENLLHISKYPPSTFYQALQLVWILHLLNNCDSFGRFDYYLNKFYINDIKNSKITQTEAKEYITDFWLKIEYVEQIQNMTIGGEDTDGNNIYTPLTALCISVTRELQYKGPNLCLRINSAMPENIWNEAIDCIKTGNGLPALYNDNVYYESLLRYGFSIETTRNYCLAGCSQIMISGQSNFINDIGLYNAVKILEITLYNGFDLRTGKQVGLKTGDVKDFISFDDFYNAYIQQLDYFVKIEIDFHNKEALHRASKEGYTLRSLFIRGCLERGLGVFCGGANYNNTELEIIGITNAADSLYAIKKSIFEDKVITFSELLDVLKNNWINNSELQKYFINLPKFGNDYIEVDAIRADITEFLYKKFNVSNGALGGIYVPGEVIFVAHDYCGKTVGATPDGRKAYQVLADSAGASNGCDKEGPTALLNSVLKLPAGKYLLTSIITNIRLLPDMFSGDDERKAVKSLLKSFFNKGGMQLQINVCDSETLLKAQKNPELYKNIIVRIGGYSDYFVRLSTDLQNEIITRTAWN